MTSVIVRYLTSGVLASCGVFRKSNLDASNSNVLDNENCGLASWRPENHKSEKEWIEPKGSIYFSHQKSPLFVFVKVRTPRRQGVINSVWDSVYSGVFF